MFFYCSDSHKNWLINHQLGTFEQLWQIDADWYEPPNYKRNGWSGVCQLKLTDQLIYLKRQHNHARRTWLKPFSGESTLNREFQVLQHLQKNSICAPALIAFGEKLQHGKFDALLMMEALNHYVSLEHYAATQAITPPLIIAIATAIRQLHATGIQHRSLYPKHIFIKEKATIFEIAFIDFEKSRFTLLPKLRAITDLSTFLRKVNTWPDKDRMLFFMTYYGLDITMPKLNFAYRALWFIMQKR